MGGKELRNKIIAFALLVVLSGVEGIDAIDIFKRDTEERANMHSLQKTVDKIYNLQMKYCFNKSVDDKP